MAFVAADVSSKRKATRAASLAAMQDPMNPARKGVFHHTGPVDAAVILEALRDLPAVMAQMQATLATREMKEAHLDWQESPAAGYKCLSEEDIAIQHRIFGMYDNDKNGMLAQNEVKRMLTTMELFDSVDELIEVIREMDDDNSGTIELDEYMQYIDERCANDDAFHISYRNKAQNLKLGYAGTTWRRQGNVSWLSNQGIMILTCLAILQSLIYFRFVLVPLVMAYFLTFLLGPIHDVLIQRPLVCCGYVFCDAPGVRPGMNQDTKCFGKEMKWADKGANGERLYKLASERYDIESIPADQWNLKTKYPNYQEKSRCCDAAPGQACSADKPLQHSLWACLYIAKIPDAFSVVASILIAVMVIGACGVVIGHELVSVATDESFQAELQKAKGEMNDFLRDEHLMEISELMVANDTIQTYTLAEAANVLGYFLIPLNDVVLTLLLALYMLMTRTPPSEEDHYKELQRYSLFEKIQAKVSYYVVLKTALSAVTGGLVGGILLALGVRLAMVFGMLTFLLNFIPNIGSMIAMFIPLPVIYVDSLSVPAKLLAFFGPALVQAYVGNILEPTVFGKSLNVTALSVLLALVLWGSIWGVQGAVLSVPLLAAMKVALEECDYPLAKMLLSVIRESAAIDDAVQASGKKSAGVAGGDSDGSPRGSISSNPDTQVTPNPMSDVGFSPDMERRSESQE